MTRHGQIRLSPFSWFFNYLTEKDVDMRVKMGTVVPKMGTFLHLVEEPADYRTEPPRVSERIKLSEDDPYGSEEEAHPDIHGRVPRARRSAVS